MKSVKNFLLGVLALSAVKFGTVQFNSDAQVGAAIFGAIALTAGADDSTASTVANVGSLAGGAALAYEAGMIGASLGWLGGPIGAAVGGVQVHYSI